MTDPLISYVITVTAGASREGVRVTFINRRTQEVNTVKLDASKIASTDLANWTSGYVPGDVISYQMSSTEDGYGTHTTSVVGGADITWTVAATITAGAISI